MTRQLEDVQPLEVHAEFGIRGKQDYLAFFTFIHEFVLRECAEREYSSICTELQMEGRESAETPAAEVAENYRSGNILDELRLPRVKERGHFARAGSQGVELSSDSIEWLQRQADRWIAVGGWAPGMSYRTNLDLYEIPASESEKQDHLRRLLSWLLEAAGGGQSFHFEAHSTGTKRRVFREQIVGPAVPCESCHGAHPDQLPCKDLLQLFIADRLTSIEVKAFASASWSAPDGPDPASLHFKTTAPLETVARVVDRWRKSP
jgi:hypothetical protein